MPCMAPRFAAAEFARQRQRQIGHIRSLKDSDPSELLSQYGRALLFGTHPYGQPASGSEDSLQAIALSGCDRVSPRAHRRGPGGAGGGRRRRCRVAEGGSGAALRRLAAGGGAAAGRSRPTVKLRERRVLLVDAPGSAQSYFWLGATGTGSRLSAAAPRSIW